MPALERDHRRQLRLKKLWRPRADGLRGGGSVLEHNSVQGGTMRRYQEMVSQFEGFCRANSLATTTPEKVDEAMVQFLRNRFFLGYNLSQFGKHGRHSLVRSHRALKGWKRLAPPRSRVAVTIYVLGGIAAQFIAQGNAHMALWMIPGHIGYLRPSTNMSLQRRCLVKPKAGATKYWSLLLNSSERGLISKTRCSDEAVALDNADYDWIMPLLEIMKKRPDDEHLWAFDCPTLVKAIANASKRVGAAFVPYQLRHTGPSWDRSRQHRSLADIKKKEAGGGLSLRSVATRRRPGSSASTTSCRLEFETGSNLGTGTSRRTS